MNGSGSQAITEGNQWRNVRGAEAGTGRKAAWGSGSLALWLSFSYLIQPKPTVGGPHPADELTIKNMPHEPIS